MGQLKGGQKLAGLQGFQGIFFLFQSFTNEDHLTVHQRKHEILLAVNNSDHSTPALMKHPGFIIGIHDLVLKF